MTYAYASLQRSATAACTIISRSYLAQARALAESYFQHEPGGRFYLLVVDGLPREENLGSRVQVLDLISLANEYLTQLASTSELVDLCGAAKPALFSLLLDRLGEEEILYFDADILICRPLDEVREALARGDIVLTPHLLEPIPMDGLWPSDRDVLIAGAYNLGFIALKKSEPVRALLRWWQEGIRGRAAVSGDILRDIITDQKRFDLVPSLFPSTVLLRDDTYNVAWWNLHHRILTYWDERYLVNGRPLAFFHFSGFDPTRPLVLTSAPQNRYRVVPKTALARLLAYYAELQKNLGYRETSRWRTSPSDAPGQTGFDPRCVRA